MELFGDEFEICPHCGYVVGTDAAEAIHMEPGTLLYDRYIIGKVLGYGGFGVTYLGWDGKLEQKVAIKEYLPGEFSTRMPGQSQVTVFNGEKNEQFHDGLKKFVEEAKHLAKFQNEPGIVKIFDSFEENETAYIIMEYLEGETLTSYLKREKTIPEDKAVEMMLPIMESLQVVHAEGLLHRDIAPDNIFLLNNGEVKLIDFGASRYATTSHSRSLTVIIKPGYSPEEQYRSRGDQGPYTDVYAIAATLYKMITGKTPPDAMERRAKYENQNKDILEEPHKINKKISPNREVAILNAMNVRIEDRTPDVLTFIKELNADPPAKRIYGKIKKLDLYHWPLWLKIAVPSLLACVVVFVSLLLTGVINFSRFTEEIVIPEGIVIVPDVEGEYTAEALKLIESGKLLATTGGTIESEYIPAGKIILQEPVGGSYLDVNGTVVLTVSSGKGVQDAINGVSTVPYVIWDEKAVAIEKLEKAGLKDIQIEEVHDENVAAGQVISQSIEAGTEVPEGSSLTIKVSLGAASFAMPNVEGKQFVEAQNTLESKGLVVVIEYQKNNDVPENSVISQSVKVGTDVKRGDKITLVVCSGKKTINVANVIGKNYEDATDILKDQGFKVTKLENYDSKVAAGNVISQSPGAGTAQIEGTNITIIVSKGKQPINVSFDGNGGTPSTGSKTVYYTATYGSLPTATRTGYSFAGWYSAANGGVKVSDSTEVTTPSAHTLYAHWTANNYTVSFDGNGGSASSGSINVTFAGKYGTMPTATRTGHTFDGWYTAKSGGTKVVDSTTVSTASAHTLYAHWNVNSYTLSFNANGGNVSTGSTSVNYGSGYGSLPTPTRDYYNFTGWYTAASGGSKVSSSTTMGASNTTVYAQWELKPVSGWVLESNLPSGAQVVNTKWTYSKTETTESTSSSLSGWTQTGNYWKQTGSGSTNYASFPSGYDTGNYYYQNFAKSAYSAYDNGSTKREVSNSWAGYVYWHWMYSTGAAGSSTRAIYHKYGYGPDNGFLYQYFYAFTSTKGNYSSDKYYCNSQSITNYIVNDQHTSNAECGGATRWFRFDYYTSSYTDYQKIYQYKKVTDGLESSTAISNGGNISNVQKYVQYRPK